MDVTEKGEKDVVEDGDHVLGLIEDDAKKGAKYWPRVVAGLSELRRRAMLATQTNDVMNGRYRKLFGEMRDKYPHYAKLSPQEASACCWMHEHPELYEVGRSGMKVPYGTYPSPYNVYQRYTRLIRAKDRAAERANAKEEREAQKDAFAEAEKEIYDALEERDRATVHAADEKAEKEQIKEIALDLKQQNEELRAELVKVKAVTPAVAEAEKRARQIEDDAEQRIAELEQRVAELEQLNAELADALARETARHRTSPEATVAKSKARRRPGPPKPKASSRKPGPPKVVIPEIEALLVQGYSLSEISRGMNEAPAIASLLRTGHLKLTDERRAALQAYAASVGV